MSANLFRLLRGAICYTD